MIEPHATLAVERVGRFSGGARAYKVHVDGMRVGTVRANQTETFSVAPGVHRVHVTFDWTSSPEVVVDCTAGEVTRLRADQKTGAAGVFGSLTSPKDFLTLEVVGAVPAAPAPPPPAAMASPVATSPTPPPAPVAASLHTVTYGGGERRSEAVSEIVTVPEGVSIRVTRSRSFERTIQLTDSKSGGGGIGASFLGLELKGEIAKEVLRNRKAAETIEYEIELDSEKASKYRLAWVDVWRAGEATFSDSTDDLVQSFEVRDRTELVVEAVDDE